MKHLMVSVEDLRKVQRVFDCLLKDATRRQEACLYRNELDSSMILVAEAAAYSEAWKYLERLIQEAEYEEIYREPDETSAVAFDGNDLPF